MRLGFGIAALVAGAWFLYGVVRGIRQGTHHPGHTGAGILAVILFVGTGVSLLVNLHLWWLFLLIPGIAIIVWSRVYARKMERDFLNR